LTGTGTLADPFVIWDVVDLQNMNLDLTAYYQLGQNIDAAITVTWNAGAGFIPIGDSINPFTGNFDGKNYTIDRLYISRPTKDYQGLFGYTTGITDIKNVGLTNCDITGAWEVGALVGHHGDGVNDATISNAYSSGSIRGSGNSWVAVHGGLVGRNQAASTITDSHSTANLIVNVTPTFAGMDTMQFGGLVGVNHGITTDCFATGNIQIICAGANDDVKYVGGFVGDNFSSTTRRCHATGNISIQCDETVTAVGGFSGVISDIYECYSIGNIDISAGDNIRAVGGFSGYGPDDGQNCYSRGSITVTSLGAASRWIGGFVGMVDGLEAVQFSYSTGSIITSGIFSNVGGFCGRKIGTVTNCFWDTQTSGQTSSAGGTGKTTEEMNHRDIYIAAGWDLETVWNISQVSTGLGTNITPGTAVLNGLLDLTIINEAYPFLQWQTVVENPCDCGFEWGETLELGNFTPVASKNTGDAFAQSLSGLKAKTKYYFRARAHSSPGPIHGGIGTFTTAIGIEVETLPATNITEHSARIWGVVRKVPVTAMGRFDWGGNTDYGIETAWQPGLVSDDTFFVDLDNLAEGRAYHFRAVAMGNIIVYGNDMTFTTLSPLGPVTFIQEELHHILEVPS
jgi:hypothetical protein